MLGHDGDGHAARQADTAEPASAVRAKPAVKADDRRKGGEKGGKLGVMDGALRCLRIHGAALGGEVAGDLAAVAADDGVQHELVVSNSVMRKVRRY